MKTFLFAILLISWISSYSQVPASLDNTFNGTGIKIFSLGGSLDFGDNVLVQPDGNILMTGATFMGGLTKLGVCRMFPDGSYDPSFGTAGISIIDLGTLAYNGGFEPEMIRLSDGSILINGFTQEGSGTGDDMLICKLLPNGSLDPAFGTGGKVWVDLLGAGGMPDGAYNFTTDAAGNIYACGSTRTGGTPFTNDVAIIKLTPAGALDPSFSGDGKLLLDLSGNWDYAYGIHVRSDGKILVGGYSGIPADFFLIRLNPDGSFDNSFSGDGKVLVDIMGQSVADECWGMSVDPDGKILLVGDGIDASAGSIARGAVVRILPDGNPDPSFGVNGIAVISVSSTGNILRSIIRMPDGRYLVGGDTKTVNDSDFAVIRLTASGALDPSFNLTGYFVLDVSGTTKNDYGYGLALQSDGKVLVSGNTSYSSAVNEKYSIVRIIAQDVLASFSASSSLVCDGSSVQFSNTSGGSNLSYLWTFEGGTPSTSTQANPLVTYSNPGTYDVQLIAYSSNFSDTLLVSDMIEVITAPTTPGTPSGSTMICNQQSAVYSVPPVPYASGYNWAVDPVAAGSLVQNGTSATFTASPAWTGIFTIKVKATNQCGNSAWSNDLSVQVSHLPILYTIEGEGQYCEGSGGAEITLNGSETGVNYELYLEGAGTGNIQAGTGASLTWSGITTQGFYTVIGSTAECSQQMAGQIYVYELAIPGQMSTPAGPVVTCNDQLDQYTTSVPVTGDQLVWTLTPAGAGTLYPSDNSVYIEWSDAFSGQCTLSVHAGNDCGDGLESGALTITVNKSPSPQVIGISIACLGWTPLYQTFQNPGSTYSWSVTGGTVTAGGGTSQVTIRWESIGTGSVSVVETSAENCTVTSDPLLVEVDACVGFSEPEPVSALTVYPNPANQYLNFRMSKPANDATEIIITDLPGRVIASVPIEAGRFEMENLDISQLVPGVYLLILKMGEETDVMVRFVRK